MATQIKITELGSISNANLTSTTLFPGVNMVGTPLTQKVTLQQIGNVVLTGAGGAFFPPAAISNISYSVVNSAQPNITSVGTLTTLSVSGNITVGGGTVVTKVTTPYNSARLTILQIENLKFRVAIDGKSQVSVVSSSNLAWSGSSIISGVSLSFNNTGELILANNWVDLSTSDLTVVGDTLTAILQDINLNSIYRVTFIQTNNLANAAISVEKVI
jgi:hypothetical protein